jgi:hypothetical protein
MRNRALYTERLVHGDVVDDGIRTCQVNIFEYARGINRILGTLAGVYLGFRVDEDGFTGFQIPYQLEPKGIQRHAFRCDHVLSPIFRIPVAKTHGANAEGVAKGDDTIADNHSDGRISTLAALVHTGHCLEHIVLIDAQLAELHELVGEYVE